MRRLVDPPDHLAAGVSTALIGDFAFRSTGISTGAGVLGEYPSQVDFDEAR